MKATLPSFFTRLYATWVQIPDRSARWSLRAIADGGERPSTSRRGVVVELEAFDPPSAVGRAVELHLDEEQATKLLVALRRVLVDLRRPPVGT